VADSLLHVAVFNQRLEIWPIVCYIMLCVDRDVKCGRFFVT
jgi:hypothetical protein